MQDLSGPLALVAKSGAALRLTAVDAAAEALGAHPGLSLADVRARAPDVRVMPADPAADAACLEGLAEACRRYSPALAVDPPDGIVLDMTGGAHLFGGDAALMADLRRRVTAAGFSLRIAIADTPGLAWAFARSSPEDVSIPLGEGAAQLADLSVAALRPPPDQVRFLQRLGLRRIGQIVDAPRSALARRLGTAFLDRLDEALGRRASPLAPKLEVLPHRAERRLLEPIAAEALVQRVILDLATDLAPRLEGEGKGARRFRLELFRLDGAIKWLEVGASRPLRDPAAVADLFRARLDGLNDGLEAEYGFDQLRLTALVLEPLIPLTADFVTGLAGRDAPADGFAALSDRLSARFGGEAVRRFVLRATYRRPEEAAITEALVRRASTPSKGTSTPPTQVEGAPLRPLRLFAPPQPIEVLADIPEGPPARFRWRRLARRIVCAEGPERIAPEWWRTDADDTVRDYYRLEDENGCRYWVFRQGLYSDASPPRWYLQGLFA